jgi:ABC-2 type transport system permease protein
LIWTFVFPFLVILGFAFGISGSEQALFKVGTIGSNSEMAEFMKTPGLEFIDETQGYQSLHVRKVERHQLDLLVDASAHRYWVNSDSVKGATVERLLLASSKGLQLERAPVSGAEIRYVHWLIPGILAMNMMFNALFGVGYTIVRYRKNGVLKRLRATPVTAFQFLASQLVSRLFILLATSGVVLAGAYFIVRFPIRGSLVDLVLFFMVGAMSLVSMGLVVAARISTEELAEGILNIMTWPMMFLSGIWFSLEGAKPAILKFAQLLPLTHIVDGSRAILLDGATLAQVFPQMMVLAAIGFVGLVVGSLVFRWS